MGHTLDEAQDALLEIVPRFARRVQPVYKLLNERWYIGDKHRVPTVGDIERTLRELIGQNPRAHNASTCGLTVETCNTRRNTDNAYGRMSMDITEYAPARRKRRQTR